jgi:hypothetical protein
MSATNLRDLDRALEAFLDAGPDQLSNRLAASIGEEVHRTRQRAMRGPWRIPRMSRFALTSVAVAIAAVVVGLAVALTRPSPQIGTQSTPPPSAVSPTPGDFIHDTAIGYFDSGQTYRASTFSTPYSFVVPAEPASLYTGSGTQGDALDAAHAMRIRPGQGALTFHDGVGLPADLCHPEKGLLSRLPSTPQAVGEWLAATKGLTLSRLPDLAVDGRTALRWDVALGPACYSGDGTFASTPVVWFHAKEHHRLYAVPTGKGTILIATWGAGYNGEGEGILPAVNSWADELVKSLHFG